MKLTMLHDSNGSILLAFLTILLPQGILCQCHTEFAASHRDEYIENTMKSYSFATRSQRLTSFKDTSIKASGWGPSRNKYNNSRRLSELGRGLGCRVSEGQYQDLGLSVPLQYLEGSLASLSFNACS